MTFNLIAILTVFPAMIAIDLKRRRKGLRDLCCCLTSEESTEEPSYESPYGFDLSEAILTPAQVIFYYYKFLFKHLILFIIVIALNFKFFFLNVYK